MWKVISLCLFWKQMYSFFHFLNLLHSIWYTHIRYYSIISPGIHYIVLRLRNGYSRMRNMLCKNKIIGFRCHNTCRSIGICVHIHECMCELDVTFIHRQNFLINNHTILYLLFAFPLRLEGLWYVELTFIIHCYCSPS